MVIWSLLTNIIGRLSEPMKMQQSKLEQQIINFMQQNQDKAFTASHIYYNYKSNDEPEFDNTIKSKYESILNGYVRKDRLKVTTSSGDLFSTKQYHLEGYQKSAWSRSNWQV